MGIYQAKNLAGVLASFEVLKKIGFDISDEVIATGLRNVISSTGLKGRWQTIGEKPLTICDTGHNEGGIREIIQQINETPHQKLRIVLGMVKDKDISKALQWLPTDAAYYFCAASIPRALPSNELKSKAETFGLLGNAYNNVNDAVRAAREASAVDDLIFVGGSTFVVAEIENL
jgi:dihydrofolate synthase/folylpolyglutamate synthase